MKQDIDEVVIANKALEILELLDGMTVGQVTHVLRETELVLGMATTLHCKSSTFINAADTLLAATGEMVEPSFNVFPGDKLETLLKARAKRQRILVNELKAELTRMHALSTYPADQIHPTETPNPFAAEQQIAADVSAALNKHRSRNPGELADGLTAALMAQVPPAVAIQALSAAIGK